MAKAVILPVTPFDEKKLSDKFRFHQLPPLTNAPGYLSLNYGYSGYALPDGLTLGPDFMDRGRWPRQGRYGYRSEFPLVLVNVGLVPHWVGMPFREAIPQLRFLVSGKGLSLCDMLLARAVMPYVANPHQTNRSFLIPESLMVPSSRRLGPLSWSFVPGHRPVEKFLPQDYRLQEKDFLLLVKKEALMPEVVEDTSKRATAMNAAEERRQGAVATA